MTPCVSSASDRVLDDLGQARRSPGRGPPPGPSVERARHATAPAPGRPRPPCAGSRRSARGRTGRSRPGSRSTASWPARCRSRSRSCGPREAKNQRAASTPTSAEQLVEGDELAGPLGHRDLDAVAHEADPRVEQHLDGLAVVAHRLGGVADPRDRAVVVGAPDVDEVVEAAAELLGDVADVGGEVRRPAVGAVDDPVLVVAEGRRAEPQRAVLLVDVAVARAAARPPARPSPRRGAGPRSSRRRSGRRGASRLASIAAADPRRPPSGRGRRPRRAPSAVAAAQTSSGTSRGEVARRRRRGSRPPGTGSPRRTAATDAPRLSIWPPESLK